MLVAQNRAVLHTELQGRETQRKSQRQTILRRYALNTAHQEIKNQTPKSKNQTRTKLPEDVRIEKQAQGRLSQRNRKFFPTNRVSHAQHIQRMLEELPELLGVLVVCLRTPPLQAIFVTLNLAGQDHRRHQVLGHCRLGELCKTQHS